MELQEYQRLYEFEQTHGWYVGARQIVLGFLGRYIKRYDKPIKILDAGCGTGKTLQLIRKYGTPIGIDIVDTALIFCKKRIQNNILQASVCNLPFKDETFDIILSLGVLYHKLVKDDFQATRELYRVCKKRGIIIITNPAYNFLWNSHDVVTHAKKRYTLKESEKIIKNSGFTILKASYFNMFLFPYLFLQRLLKNIFRGKDDSETKPLPLIINILIIYILKIEFHMLRQIRLPFGSSVLCIGLK